MRTVARAERLSRFSSRWETASSGTSPSNSRSSATRRGLTSVISWAIRTRSSPNSGTIVPLAPEKLAPAEELDLQLGRGVNVRAIPTPGHSPDHLSYYESSGAALFTGDAVGIVLPAYDFLGPVTPPPGFDVVAQHATFQRLLDLPIAHLLFSHWGPSLLPAHELIRRLRERFDAFDQLIRSSMQQVAIDETAIIRATLPDEPLPTAGEWVIAGWIRMNIKGLVRYYTKNPPRA